MGRFDKIRIIAVNDAIFVKSVRLQLSGGKVREVKVDQLIRKDSSTVEIDLPGDRETIRGAEVEYKVRLPSTAYVALEGLVSNEPGGFEVLESKVLDTKDDQVTLRVESETPVTSIRLRAWVNPVQVRRAEILFGNGDRQEVRIRDTLNPGDATEAIDVDGRKRNIKSVTLTLRPQRGQAERSRIDLLGKAAELDRRGGGRRGEHGSLDRDWKLLGTRNVAIFSKDSDTFRVGESAGLFKSIRVRALGEDVRMYGMQIRYGNGVVEDVPIYGTLGAGQLSQAFDLKGRSRYIDEITFRYRTKLNLRRQAEVEVWGEQVDGGKKTYRRR
ncbi:MAG: hypothetical protein KJ622_15660 [Alphaproteobacteria bacterium]|nr:hypothetical protein [Alphaproteobacteria bacterium]